MSCPSGTQLLNSTSGTSAGVFDAEIQECRPCTEGTYVINPNKDACQDCPAGASPCPGFKSLYVFAY